jgi:hypothetical protein
MNWQMQNRQYLTGSMMLHAWLAGSWSSPLYVKIVVCVADGLAWLRRAVLGLPPIAIPEDPVARATDVAAAQRFSAVTAGYRRAAFILSYVIWFVFCWISLVYGNMVYESLGAQSVLAVVNSWGVSFGLGQIRDFQNLAITVAEIIFLMTVMEILWLVPTAQWLEQQLDFLSVFAASLQSDHGIRPSVTRVVLKSTRFFNAVN